jgi:hypothetical protein
MPSRGVLRIHSWGGISVEDARDLLWTVEHCYDSIYAYEAFVEAATEGWDLKVPWGFLRREGLWLQPGISPHEFVSLRYRLILRATQLRSPGFLDFLGKLNPLEVMRVFLNDVHERRKDREYREDAERERLQLENAIRRTELAEKQLGLLKAMGITEAELAYLRNRFILQPLRQLGDMQDRRPIGSAELDSNFVDEEGSEAPEASE